MTKNRSHLKLYKSKTSMVTPIFFFLPHNQHLNSKLSMKKALITFLKIDQCVTDNLNFEYLIDVTNNYSYVVFMEGIIRKRALTDFIFLNAKTYV